MHFDTSTGEKGETAVLQSRILFPNRKHQCLQFFFKITGSHQDKLAIWIKKDDDSEKMCKVRTFQGDDDYDWKIAHVNLKSQKKFRYLIYGLKGEPDDSSGGISIDDLTLSETQCPGSVWLIRNFSTILKTSTENHVIWSPRFYSHEGYGYSVSLFPRGPGGSVSESYIGISFHLVSGENDDALEWPALHRQVTITVLDQDPNIKERMSSERSFTTDSTQILPGGGNTSRWGKPLAGKYDPMCNCRRSRGLGWSRFISHAQLRRRNYLRNDDLIIFAEFEDLRHLMKTEHSFPQMWSILENEPLEQKRSELPRDWKSSQIVECNPNPCQSDGIGKISKGNQAADMHQEKSSIQV